MHAVEFYWDPMCPFAWVTSRWLAKVEAQGIACVDWRFISLRILNEGKDYERDFPPGYATLHGKGLRMLRVAAAVRERHGAEAMGPIYTAFGESIWDRPYVRGAVEQMAGIAEHAHLCEVLASCGFEPDLAAAADDDRFDDEVRVSTERALSLAGRDVGTPVIAVDPPEGPAFFGPVISEVPDDTDAVALWDAVMTLARWPSFAELKRSLRTMPRLPLLTRPVDAAAAAHASG
jgi:2-hydroxychromene-2-carboxylate isomerase